MGTSVHCRQTVDAFVGPGSDVRFGVSGPPLCA